MTAPALRQILVARTDALGDALLALPVCAALRRAVPGVRVTFLAAARHRELFTGQPGLDAVWAYDAEGEHAGPQGAARLREQLRSGGFDAALLVFPDRRVSWAAWRAGIPRRLGTGRRWWSLLYTDRVSHSRARADRHEADYNLDLVRALGVSAEVAAPVLRVGPAARTWADQFLAARGFAAGRPFAVLHPGSRGSAANWPPELYGRLAAELLRAKHPVLLTGTPAEAGLLRTAALQCPTPPALLDEPASLPQFAALLGRAAVFVSGSTGPMHLAAALGRPTVSLFPADGVTGPVRWRPLGTLGAVLTPPAGRPVAEIPVAAVVAAVGAQWPGRRAAQPARRRTR